MILGQMMLQDDDKYDECDEPPRESPDCRRESIVHIVDNVEFGHLAEVDVLPFGTVGQVELERDSSILIKLAGLIKLDLSAELDVREVAFLCSFTFFSIWINHRADPHRLGIIFGVKKVIPVDVADSHVERKIV